ncbi:MAG: RdgB/HAM1 family non-canonical purine NTP pyrophosphatase [Leptolyngbyaceae cyanobacterium CSU_1_3]|nr:RdgB/HAM1 family non-canonical purine NTP pyrophosphatase [Leptolyngbyaceae cyanobacterium CSU_1_3]
MTKLIVATGNPGKLREMQSYLMGLDWELMLKPDELDIEETGITFAENAALKASQVAKALGEWSIADDSGLAVDALKGAPGLFSARYGATDGDRISRLLRELGDAPDRRAQFVCAIAVAQPDGEIVLAAVGPFAPDEILPRTDSGAAGLGTIQFFMYPEQQMTFAEMPPDVKHKVSHRGRAFEILLPKLRSISRK